MNKKWILYIKIYNIFLSSFTIKIKKKIKKLRTARLEHATYRFGVCCSADWAKSPNLIFCMFNSF